MPIGNPYALHVFIEAMALIVAVVRSRYQTSYPDGVRSRMVPARISAYGRQRGACQISREQIADCWNKTCITFVSS